MLRLLRFMAFGIKRSPSEYHSLFHACVSEGFKVKRHVYIFVLECYAKPLEVYHKILELDHVSFLIPEKSVYTRL